MTFYRGQTMTAIGALFIALAIVCLVGYGLSGQRVNEPGIFLLFVAGCLATIAGLTLLALGYTHWVPKWEREERRTGHIPGE